MTIFDYGLEVWRLGWGVHVGQETINNFENNSSDWLKLFEEGNKVLTALRMTSDK